jgi:hypothetical protein
MLSSERGLREQIVGLDQVDRTAGEAGDRGFRLPIPRGTLSAIHYEFTM